MPLWFYNLAVYCIQLAILIAVGGLMAAITRLREPRIRLLYWQILLALGLLLPALEPWQTAPQVEEKIAEAGKSMGHAGNTGMAAAATFPAHVPSAFSVYEIVALLLAVGLLFRLVWLAVGLMRLRRSRRQASPLGYHPSVERLKSELGVSPAVLVSQGISSPVTYGWRAPQVLLPLKFTHMDEARQHAILCHEFLHVRRRDWLWHVAEETVRALFWFHLAVTWLIAQIRLSREQVVDRGVVAFAGSRRDYLNALYEIASGSSSTRHAPALLFLSERHLKRRVTLILKEVAMSRKKLFFAISASLAGLLFAAVLVVAVLPLQTTAAQDSPQVNAATVRPETHFYGNPDARVTVVEFGDFQCPACRKAESVAEQVRKNLGGQVRFAYRQFPLTRIHHEAEKAAEAAECAAGQGKFWQAVDYLSDHPLDFSSSGIRQFATSIGLDPSQTMQCLSSGAMATRVQQDTRDGQRLGVHRVPTFFVGNTKIVGIPSYSKLHALIEVQLRGNSNAEIVQPNGANMLSAESLAPTLAQGLTGENNEQAGAPAQKSGSADDPPLQQDQNASVNSETGRNTYFNQDEIQGQIDEAMKQTQIAQKEAVKIDQAKIQEQIDQAMKQLKMAEAVAPKIDQAKINQQIEQAMKQMQMAKDAVPMIDQEKLQEQIEQSMKQFEKMNTPEMQQRMQEQMKQLEKMNSAEMRQHMEQAKKQLEKMNTPEMRQQLKEQMKALEKMNTPEMRRQVEQAMAQAKVAQEGATQVDKAEMERQLENAKKQIEQARQEARAARKEAEKARQEAIRAREEAREQRKADKPSPSAEPKPAPAPPKEVAPAPPKPPTPPAPSAPPAPPAKPPEAAGIVGGVPGGVVAGVPGGVVSGVTGGKVTGVQGGQVKGIEGGKVIGVPGGISGGVITAPQPPVPPSTSSKEDVPPPSANPAPPSSPQN